MSEFKGKRLVVSEEMHVDFPPETVWTQLCPVAEYDWIEAWDCELVHSVSGVNELDCVFMTDFPTECGREVWVTSRFEPHERIEFVRMNSARVIRFIIELKPDATGTTLTWTQHITSLTEEGDEYIKTKPEAFAMQMMMVQKFLNHHLETGEMLRGENIGLTEHIRDHVHNR